MNDKNASRRSLVIAVDGPAASGKGTLGRKLAAHFGLPHLDTGLLYRAVGRKYLAAGGNDTAVAIAAAKSLHIGELADKTLHGEEIGRAASIISAIPEVRAALLEYQRKFSQQPQGAVLDGRDIGTVICPDADVKLYITASAKVRAQRRYEQQKKTEPTANYESILAAIMERDMRDSRRAAAPLSVASDAIAIDTSTMDIDAVFARAVEIITVAL